MAPRTTNLAQVNWTAPLTNRVLVEARPQRAALHEGPRRLRRRRSRRASSSSRTASASAARIRRLFFDDENRTPVVKGAVSYVTGTHALKAGGTYRDAAADQFYEVFQDITFTTHNYRPVLGARITRRRTIRGPTRRRSACSLRISGR